MADDSAVLASIPGATEVSVPSEDIVVVVIIDRATGLVVNRIQWDGKEQWAGDDDQTFGVLESNAQIGWSYSDGKFSSPPVTPPTSAETLATNQAMLIGLQAAASQAMTPLLVSLQLGDATDEETASAKAWQAYVRSLKAVDLSVVDPVWPTAPA